MNNQILTPVSLVDPHDLAAAKLRQAQGLMAEVMAMRDDEGRRLLTPDQLKEAAEIEADLHSLAGCV